MSISRAFKPGVTPKRYAREQARKGHDPGYRPKKLGGWQMNALQRFQDLDRLARLRARSGNMGPELGWIEVIANYHRVRHGTVSAKDVHAEAAKLMGMPQLDAALVADAVEHICRAAWGTYKLYSPRLAGEKLQLKAHEREAAEIKKMDAVDESRGDRKRRLTRERMRQQRAAEAAQRQERKKMSDLVAELAAEHQKSVATIYRWLADGRLENENFRVRRSNPLRG